MNSSDAPPPSTPSGSAPRARADVRRLTVLYVFALSTVAVLSIGAQWLVQQRIRDEQGTSRVINLAGRQRMLSQQLAKAALRLSTGESEEAAAARQELTETLAEWSRSHAGLQSGDDELGLTGGNSPAVRRRFEEIEPHFEAIRAAAGRLSVAADDAEAVAAIQENEADFLAGMDSIVSQYVDESEQRVARLSRLEYAILALTLLVLLAEGLLIFRPAVRRIGHTMGRLHTLSRQLQRAKEEADLGAAAKTRFLANVSHELRTPMTAVLGMTELAQQTDDEAERRHYLSIVEEAGGSLLGLLNDLIDVARIDAGHVELETAPFSPQDVIERVMRMMRLACVDKGIELRAEKPPIKLPLVLGDAGRLEQVLLNLVGNAVKWTEVGSVTVGVQADALASDHASLRFWVEDTGVGIGKADQRRVFAPFTQLPGARSPGRGGAGLGLAICRRIAEAMNARLDLSSTPGVGTLVSLTGRFALASADDPSDEPAAVAPLPGGVRVLVVEDTEVNQLLLRRLLEQEGCVVEVVASGEKALAHYQSDPSFDAVLVDLELPGIDGDQTAAELRRCDQERGLRSPPLVCVTAHAGPAAPIPGDRFDAVLTKPITRRSLREGLAGVLTAENSAADSNDALAADALTAELAAAFVDLSGPQIDSLRAALDDRRMADARVLAHRFRGQVANFSMPPTEAVLRRLELACEAGDAEEADRQGHAALAALAEAVEHLRAGRQGEAQA